MQHSLPLVAKSTKLVGAFLLPADFEIMDYLLMLAFSFKTKINFLGEKLFHENQRGTDAQ